MKNSFYVIVFVLAVATAYAVSQAAPGTPVQDPAQSTPSTSTASRPDAPASQSTSSQSSTSQSSTSGAASSDDALKTQIQQQFATQGLSAVVVSVDKGAVTLTGSVPSKED